MRALAVGLVGLLLTFAIDPVAAGPCAQGGIALDILTKQPVAEGGGVVIAAVPSFGVSVDEDLVQKAWRFESGAANTAAEPTIQVRAPGLAVYLLPVGTDDVNLVDAGGRVRARAKRATNQPLLAAPVVTKVVRRSSKSGGRRPSFTDEVLATLDGKVPAGAVALVIYSADGAKPVARSWTRVGTDSAGPIVVYSSPGRCQRDVGRSPSAVKSKVRLAWLDGSGRLSPMSKPLIVAAK